MSYDDWEGGPDYAKLEPQESGLIMFSCKCPRCGGTVTKSLGHEDIIYGFEVECTDPRCVAPGERYGYRLVMEPTWHASILGRLDRPLHEAP